VALSAAADAKESNREHGDGNGQNDPTSRIAASCIACCWCRRSEHTIPGGANTTASTISSISTSGGSTCT
jgi:hypothetical protein